MWLRFHKIINYGNTTGKPSGNTVHIDLQIELNSSVTIGRFHRPWNESFLPLPPTRVLVIKIRRVKKKEEVNSNHSV